MELTTETKTEVMMKMPLLDQDPIFDSITTPQSCGGGLDDDSDSAAAKTHYVSTCRTIYLPYKEPTVWMKSLTIN